MSKSIKVTLFLLLLLIVFLFATIYQPARPTIIVKDRLELIKEIKKEVNATNEYNRSKTISFQKDLDLNYIDVSNVKNMRFLFNQVFHNVDLEDLEGDIYLSVFVPQQNEIERQIFRQFLYKTKSNRIELSSKTISEWDVSNVTDMSYMFLGNDFQGDISKWDVSNVENMRGMFLGSTFSGDISKWDVSNVKNMDHMFASSIFFNNLSSWNLTKVESKVNMFKDALYEKLHELIDSAPTRFIDFTICRDKALNRKFEDNMQGRNEMNIILLKCAKENGLKKEYDHRLSLVTAFFKFMGGDGGFYFGKEVYFSTSWGRFTFFASPILDRSTLKFLGLKNVSIVIAQPDERESDKDLFQGQINLPNMDCQYSKKAYITKSELLSLIAKENYRSDVGPKPHDCKLTKFKREPNPDNTPSAKHRREEDRLEWHDANNYSQIRACVWQKEYYDAQQDHFDRVSFNCEKPRQIIEHKML